MYWSRRLQKAAVTLACSCFLLLGSACQSAQGQHLSDVTHPGSSLHITPTAIQVPRQMNTPIAKKTSPAPNSDSGTIAPGSGRIPAAFPRYFSFAVMSPPGGTAALDDMRSRNGTAFAFRYQYLAGGVNTNH